MAKLVVILDPAHGSDIKGKRSPNGTHREYLWSRERVKSIQNKLLQRGFEVFVTTNSDTEPGLTNRKNFASGVKAERKLLLSLHNDAKNSDGTWQNTASGFSVWTSKGVTKSDTCSEIMFEQLKQDFPNVKARAYNTKPNEKDFESNFTVLMGTYMAVLLEWLFQDNSTDVEMLQNATINEEFENSIVCAIEKIDQSVK